MANKGFVFSIISVVILLVIASIVVIPVQNNNYSLSEFALQQKQHDLLIVWQGREIKSPLMLYECQKVFEKRCAGIVFGNRDIQIPNVRIESIHWFNENLEFEKISVLVYN